MGLRTHFTKLVVEKYETIALSIFVKGLQHIYDLPIQKTSKRYFIQNRSETTTVNTAHRKKANTSESLNSAIVEIRLHVFLELIHFNYFVSRKCICILLKNHCALCYFGHGTRNLFLRIESNNAQRNFEFYLSFGDQYS